MEQGWRLRKLIRNCSFVGGAGSVRARLAFGAIATEETDVPVARPTGGKFSSAKSLEEKRLLVGDIFNACDSVSDAENFETAFSIYSKFNISQSVTLVSRSSTGPPGSGKRRKDNEI